MNKISISTSLAILLAVMVLGGCSGLPFRPPEEIIADRALAQARYLMDRDYDSALTYVVPSYQDGLRAKFYEAEFVGSASWVDASVRWVECGGVEQADRCKVRLWIYGSLGGRLNSARGDDVPWSWDTVWVKIDGEWYQYLD